VEDLYPKAIGQGRQNIGSILVLFDQDKVHFGDDVYPLSEDLLELSSKRFLMRNLSRTKP